PVVEWPSTLATHSRFLPAASISVAAVWRIWQGGRCLSPRLRSSGYQMRLVKFTASIGLPSWLWKAHGKPSTARVRWASKAARTWGTIGMVRREPSVLVPRGTWRARRDSNPGFGSRENSIMAMDCGWPPLVPGRDCAVSSGKLTGAASSIDVHSARGVRLLLAQAAE